MSFRIERSEDALAMMRRDRSEIQKLFLHYNSLQLLDYMKNDFPALHYLNIDITSEKFPDFNHLHYLKKLLIFHPMARKIPKLPIDLEQISFWNGKIEYFPDFQDNKKLLFIEIRYCSLRTSPDFNHNHSNLTELSLPGNNLSSIGNFPKKLKTLRIYHNNLESLPEKACAVRYRYVISYKYPRWLKYVNLVGHLNN